MQYSLATIFALAASVSAVAVPDTNWKTSDACPTTTSTVWKTSTAPAGWGTPTPTTPAGWGTPTPTTPAGWGNTPTTSSKWGKSKTTLSTAVSWGGSPTGPAQPTSTGGSPACDNNGSWSWCSPDQCTANGGEPYQCTTIGLLNLLNCISLLNGDTISIPISISLL